MQETSIRTVDLRRYQRMVVPEGVGIRVSGREGGRAFEGTVTVIGLGGMFCRANDKRPYGTALTLLLTCPVASLQVEGTVRHSNEQGMGIEFTGLTRENRQKLEKLLHQLQA